MPHSSSKSPAHTSHVHACVGKHNDSGKLEGLPDAHTRRHEGHRMNRARAKTRLGVGACVHQCFDKGIEKWDSGSPRFREVSYSSTLGAWAKHGKGRC
eukprot:scaffold67856_cov28-Tisochrysis_lutea.AAC.2